MSAAMSGWKTLFVVNMTHGNNDALRYFSHVKPILPALFTLPIGTFSSQSIVSTCFPPVFPRDDKHKEGRGNCREVPSPPIAAAAAPKQTTYVSHLIDGAEE